MTTGDTNGDTTGDTNGDTTGDTTGEGSQASVECVTTNAGVTTNRAAVECNQFMLLFVRRDTDGTQSGFAVLAETSDQIIGSFNTLATAYQTLSEPVCQLVQDGVDIFVPAADPAPLTNAIQDFLNFVSLSAGQNLLFADLSGNSVGELGLQSQEVTPGFIVNFYPGPGNLMLPPGQAVRMTSTGGDVAVKSLDFETATALDWPDRIDSSTEVLGPYSYSIPSFVGSPLDNVIV